MSPEQVEGQEADHRADLFAFGAILYEMLTGRRAFEGTSAAAVMSTILRDEPAELSEINDKVPPQLERIVRRCLEKRPEQQFHSAHDLGFALEALSTPSGSNLSAAAGLTSAEASEAMTARSARTSREWMAWIGMGLFFILFLAALPFTIAHLRHAPVDMRIHKLSVLSVEVKANTTFEAGVPKALFEIHSPVSAGPFQKSYAVTADGQRVLVNLVVEQSAATPITVVLNWTADLKR
jgi:serine/threonine protein kinase